MIRNKKESFIYKSASLGSVTCKSSERFLREDNGVDVISLDSAIWMCSPWIRLQLCHTEAVP